ncbi:hypothetical protein ACT7DH_15485 [Bacillus pacificus]
MKRIGIIAAWQPELNYTTKNTRVEKFVKLPDGNSINHSINNLGDYICAISGAGNKLF